ncbi:MAG: S-layer homology domain-containing protein, partial [Tepidanaerobacteraceae bacterium]
LGITKGIGNNQFAPDANITRQDMMVLTERALNMLNILKTQGSPSDLAKYKDTHLISEYAAAPDTIISSVGSPAA